MLSRTTASRPDRSAGITVLAASGMLGLAAGLMHATWQWAVEIAQVQAGLVISPAAISPFQIHTHIWSLVPQLLAPALAIGLSERAASGAISGLIGVLSFQAIAMVVFAIARRVWIAVAAPLLIFLTGAALHGVTYPIFMAGTSHTYGALGLSLTVLTLALLASGHLRIGGFLLGLTPAVHLTSGAWTLACVMLVALVDRRSRALLVPALRPALAALAVCAGSLAWHLAVEPRLAAADPASSRRYLEAFVQYWDGHRIPASWRAPGSIFTIALVVVSVGWLGRVTRITDSARLMLLLGIVSAVAALAASTLSWAPTAMLPTAVVIAMPGRFLNVGAMMFAAVLVGLLASLPDRRSRGVALAIFCGALLLTRQSALVATIAAWQPGLGFAGISQGAVLLGAATGLVIWAVVRGRRGASDAVLEATWPVDGGSRRPWVRVAIAAATCLGLALSWVLAGNVQGLQHAGVPLWDRTDAQVLDAAAGRPGVLVNSGYQWLVQARTRRPVLFDLFTIDGIPYALGAAPAVNTLLGEVFDLDLLNPPPAANTDGHLRINHAAWERFTRERWQQIRRTYGVTDVLTKADWRLDLPIVAASPGLRLYEIPE